MPSDWSGSGVFPNQITLPVGDGALAYVLIVVSENTTPGEYHPNLVLTNLADNSTQSIPLNITVVAASVIESLAPETVLPGGMVEVIGHGLLSASQVIIKDNANHLYHIDPSNISDSHLSFIVPPDAPSGNYNVSIVVLNGFSSNALPFQIISP